MGVSLCLLDSTLSMCCLGEFSQAHRAGRTLPPCFIHKVWALNGRRGWLGLYRSSLDLVYSVLTETQKYGAQPPALSQSFQRNYVPMSVTSTELSEC